MKKYFKVSIFLGLAIILGSTMAGKADAAPEISYILMSSTPVSSSPTTIWVDEPFSVEINGSGFVNGALVALHYPNTPHPSTHLTTYNSDKKLTWNSVVGYPAGNYKVEVYNPPYPGGELSNPKEFNVVYLPPTVTSLMPAEGVVREPISSLKIYGNYFYSNSVAYVDGKSRATELVVNQNSPGVYLRIPMFPADFKEGSSLSIEVVNLSPGGGASQPVNFKVKVPVAFIDSIYPRSVLLGSPDVVMEITGTGFIDGITMLHGSYKDMKVVSPTKIKFSSPASDHLSVADYYYSTSNKGQIVAPFLGFGGTFRVVDPNADGKIRLGGFSKGGYEKNINYWR